tara:strand:+ start:1993 stop:2433 length:441 start_codon:yes stop_codon:yes gene_type:complete
MKNLFLLLFFPTMLFAQDTCYTVEKVTTTVEMEEISQRRITFGIKQMMEDIISDKYDLCMDGKPVEVQVTSIEAPTTGIEIGPWTKVSKKTIVTLLVYMDGKVIEVEGKAKSTVEATFIDLQNDQLPFNKTAFASAVKKAIEKSIK